jgi:hypothetical protein
MTDSKDPKLDSGIYKTFVERGAAVPLETKKLHGARLRVIGGKPELSVASFYDGDARALISLGSVHKAFTLSMGDRMVLDKLVAETLYTPSNIRRTILEVERTGAYGIERAEKAEECLVSGNEKSAYRSFVLLMNCAKEAGLPPPSAADMRSGNFQESLSKLVNHIVGNDSNARIELHDALKQWGEILSMTGMPGSKDGLRATRDQVASFVENLREWAGSRPQDEAELAETVAAVASDALARVDKTFGALDVRLTATLQTLKTWQSKSGLRLYEGAQELDWLLDGWDEAVALWKDSASLPEGSRRDVVRAISMLIPMLPDEVADESVKTNRKKMNEFGGKKYIKANVDWLTGIRETELLTKAHMDKNKAAA